MSYPNAIRELSAALYAAYPGHEQIVDREDNGLWGLLAYRGIPGPTIDAELRRPRRRGVTESWWVEVHWISSLGSLIGVATRSEWAQTIPEIVELAGNVLEDLP